MDATKESVVKAIIRVCLTWFMSAFCSLLSCLYIASVLPFNHKGRTCSTSWKSHSSQTSSTNSNRSTIGRSAATPLNTGISWMSNYLLIIVWCWNSLNRIKKVSVNQHTKSVLSLLQLFLLLCLWYAAASFTSVKSGFCFATKAEICCLM